MFKDTCLIAHKRIDRSPRINSLEIPHIVSALERDHLIAWHTNNQNATNMYYECMK
jgi:hypothetical protein